VKVRGRKTKSKDPFSSFFLHPGDQSAQFVEEMHRVRQNWTRLPVGIYFGPEGPFVGVTGGCRRLTCPVRTKGDFRGECKVRGGVVKKRRSMAETRPDDPP